MKTPCVVESLLEQLQDLLDQEPLAAETHLSAPYVGPRYCEGQRILFLGLDAGKPDDPDANVGVMARQQGILSYYRDGQRSWNPHYKGCVWTAAQYLKSNCSKTCNKHCVQKSESECVLLKFSQTNAKHTVPKDTPNMTAAQSYGQLPAMLSKELELLDADLVVVQSRSKLAKPLRALIAPAHEWIDSPEQKYVAKIVWSDPGRSDTQVALFVHPSARGNFHFSKLWDSEIVPTLNYLEQERSRGEL